LRILLLWKIIPNQYTLTQVAARAQDFLKAHHQKGMGLVADRARKRRKKVR